VIACKRPDGEKVRDKKPEIGTQIPDYRWSVVCGQWSAIGSEKLLDRIKRIFRIIIKTECCPLLANSRLAPYTVYLIPNLYPVNPVNFV
jgi:hypothetical protein